MALTDQELKDMEKRLRRAFELASKGADQWEYNVFSTLTENAMTGATSISALANTAQALLAVDQEIKRRSLDSGYKPRDM